MRVDYNHSKVEINDLSAAGSGSAEGSGEDSWRSNFWQCSQNTWATCGIMYIELGWGIMALIAVLVLKSWRSQEGFILITADSIVL